MVTKQVKKPKTSKEPGQYIPLDDLLPNPYQPETRVNVDPETAKKFAYSIQEHGLIQMPVVRPGKEDGKYEVGDGWLRRAGSMAVYRELAGGKR
jgi:ParB-like chromosome segregation protein Spo0J